MTYKSITAVMMVSLMTEIKTVHLPNTRQRQQTYSVSWSANGPVDVIPSVLLNRIIKLRTRIGINWSLQTHISRTGTLFNMYKCTCRLRTYKHSRRSQITDNVDTNGNSEYKLQPQKGGIFCQANISINCVVIRIMITIQRRPPYEFKIHLFVTWNEQINL